MNADEEAVRQRAYKLWEQRGRGEGAAEQDWFEAQRQMRRDNLADADGNLIALPNERPDRGTRVIQTTAPLRNSPNSLGPVVRSRKKRSRNVSADAAETPHHLLEESHGVTDRSE
jgi:hypothetical protein